MHLKKNKLSYYYLQRKVQKYKLSKFALLIRNSKNKILTIVCKENLTQFYQHGY